MSLCSRSATVRIQQISENRAGKVEGHTVLAHIRRGLDLIPLELKLPLIHQLLTLVPCYSRLMAGWVVLASLERGRADCQSAAGWQPDPQGTHREFRLHSSLSVGRLEDYLERFQQ